MLLLALMPYWLVDGNTDVNVCDAIRIVNKKSPEENFGAFEIADRFITLQ